MLQRPEVDANDYFGRLWFRSVAVFEFQEQRKLDRIDGGILLRKEVYRKVQFVEVARRNDSGIFLCVFFFE